MNSFFRKKIYIVIEKVKKIINDVEWEVNSAALKENGKNTRMEIPFTLRGGQYISVGDNFHCCRGGRIQAIDNYEGEHFTPSISIGDNVSINMDAEISSINKIVIGNGVQIASNVLITDHFHGQIDHDILNVPPAKRKLFSKGPVIIGENVWIGFNVAILPGVTIGDNSIIGAGAVVTKNVPSNSIYIGAGKDSVIRTL